ncbi:MAG TPA: protein-disulfide reductase DsbD [Gammaproteobacteria bacterium]|jgi:thiol:disulfide interchange protein DsbD|nr:protein-disulfide reductase DsbD [Gammaproteobacteria bacterium]
MAPYRTVLRIVACTLLALAGNAALAQDPPPPQQVFKYSTRADADRVYLDFGILNGYYLYRARFGFDSGTDGVSLGAASFPRGETHKDEYFGEQEVYRGKFTIAIPYKRTGAASAVDLKLRLQGCADFGLCYLPQDWTAKIALPPGAAGAAARPGLLDIGGTPTTAATSPATDDLLPADQAFVMNARFDKPNELTVAWQIAPGYYLYRDKLTFSATGKIELGAARLPDGKPHTDDNFGAVQVFRDFVEAKVPFSRASPGALDVVITAGFQGCKDNSICYPPGEQTMPMVLPATSEFPASATASGAPGPVSEQDQWAARIITGSWFSLLGWFYLGGLALSLTPCVLPMVPILSSIIAGQGAVSTRRGFLLSLSYVLGMAATYTSAGALAALAGGQIQALFQKPWIITLFAGLFAVLALSMFGLFELQMPTALQTRLANLANRQKAGTFLGTAVIGALTALIVTTCVAPPLVGALAVIGQTGDVARGSGALFALSIGMGSPLLLVGASAGQLLPRVGPWMNTVKAAFGVLMLGMAIWMMERVLPGSVTLVLWSLLVFLTGVFLGAFEALPANPSPMRRLAKGFGVLACLYGSLLLIGATLGGEDPLRPIPQAALARAGTGGAVAATRPALEFRPIETVAALDQALTEARAAHQPVMLDFTADWCISCKEMEHNTFPDQGVIGALKPFMLLRADVTANDKDDQALLQRFHSFGPPTIAFFDAGGTERENFKLVGFVPPAEFTKHVTTLAAL